MAYHTHMYKQSFNCEDRLSITVNATTYKYFRRASISFADCHILYSPITAMTLSLCDLLFRRHRQTYMFDNATEV